MTRRPFRAPLRLDRVQAARERIRLQYYDRPDVKRALVEAILIEIGI